MGKKIRQYTLNSVANIINRSSDIGDETAETTQVDVTNVTTTDIRSAITEDNNSVKSLHDSALVNKFSNFSPITKGISSNNWTYTTKSPATMGNFAGYNHSAIEGYIESVSQSPNPKHIWRGDEDTIELTVKVHLGEINFPVIVNGYGVKARLYDNFGVSNGEGSIADYSTVWSNNANGDDVSGNIVFDVDVLGISDYYNYDDFELRAYGIGSNGSLPLKIGEPNLNITIHDISLNTSTQGAVQPTYCNLTGGLGTLKAEFNTDGFIVISWVNSQLSGNFNCTQAGNNPGTTDADGDYTGCVQIKASIYDEDDVLQHGELDITHFCMTDGEGGSHVHTTIWDKDDINYTDYIIIYIYTQFESPIANPCGSSC